MQVLKFGGTSVANTENIQKTIQVIQQSGYSRCLIVVSALSGVTDLLIKTGTTAADGHEQYKQFLAELEKKHIDKDEFEKLTISYSQALVFFSVYKLFCLILIGICRRSPICFSIP